MNARDKILNAVKMNQPQQQEAVAVETIHAIRFEDATAKFIQTLEGIGGSVLKIRSLDEIPVFINNECKEGLNIVTTIEDLPGIKQLDQSVDSHTLGSLDLAVIASRFAVAENGAVWVTDVEMKIRVLPFICQHLAVLVYEEDILHNMHDAYARIADAKYNFAAFIAGPSKTADIEQSLVLGAHGPKEMIVFILHKK